MQAYARVDKLNPTSYSNVERNIVSLLVVGGLLKHFPYGSDKGYGSYCPQQIEEPKWSFSYIGLPAHSSFICSRVVRNSRGRAKKMENRHRHNKTNTMMITIHNTHRLALPHTSNLNYHSSPFMQAPTPTASLLWL